MAHEGATIPLRSAIRLMAMYEERIRELYNELERWRNGDKGAIVQ